jgi:hypothetical protein
MMTYWQTALLAGAGLTVFVEIVALIRLRTDKSAQGKRLRQQALGIILMVGVIPIGYLLRDRLGVLMYALALFVLAAGGIALFVRGGGWGVGES